MEAMNELGFYTLVGAPKSPRELISEVAQGEALGLGACFVSERFNVKEADAWLAPTATGSPERSLAPVVAAWRKRRPAGCFDQLPANPAAAPERQRAESGFAGSERRHSGRREERDA